MNIWALLGVTLGIGVLLPGVIFLGLGYGTAASDAEFVKNHVYSVCNGTGYTLSPLACYSDDCDTGSQCYSYTLQVTYQLQNGQTALNDFKGTYPYCSQREAGDAATLAIGRLNNGTIVSSARGTKRYPASQCYYDIRDPSIFAFGVLPDPASSAGLGIAGIVMTCVGGAMVIPGSIVMIYQGCR